MEEHNKHEAVAVGQSSADQTMFKRYTQAVISWKFYIFPVIAFLVFYFLAINYAIKFFFPDIEPIIITTQIFSFSCIFGIAALSLNLEIGNTGLTNFGKVAFIMVGSYTTGLMMMFQYNIFIAFTVGIIVTAFMGYLISIPTLNLREDYLAIVTIVIGEILRTVFNTEKWITYPQDGKFGGPIGIQVPNVLRSLIPEQDFVFGPIYIKNTIFVNFVYLLILVVLLLVVYLLLEALINSPWGRILKGIRENDIGVESLGKDIVTYKRNAFILSSGIAGFSGALWAVYIVSFAPSGFMPILTFNLWIVVILGGIANNGGVIVGSFIFWTLEGMTRLFKTNVSQLLTNFSHILDPINQLPFVPTIQTLIELDPISLQNIIFGVVLILFLIYRPQGIIKERPIKTIASDYVKFEKTN